MTNTAYNTIVKQYNTLLPSLTKKRLLDIDRIFFCDDVKDYFGHNLLKGDIIYHLTFSTVDDVNTLSKRDIKYNTNLMQKIFDYVEGL